MLRSAYVRETGGWSSLRLIGEKRLPNGCTRVAVLAEAQLACRCMRLKRIQNESWFTPPLSQTGGIPSFQFGGGTVDLGIARSVFSRVCAIGSRHHHRHHHTWQLFWPKSLRQSPPPRSPCPCAEACPQRITSAIPVTAQACDLERQVRHPVAPPRRTVRCACCGVETQVGLAHPASRRDRRTDKSAPLRRPLWDVFFDGSSD